MATTAVFAEIIVIGLQVEAWLALYATAFGTLPDLDGLERWVALVTVVAVAAAYMLGVVLDRVADVAFEPLRQIARWIRHPVKPASNPTSGEVSEFRKRRLFVLQHANGGLLTFLEYQRSRFRIARATAVNVAITIPATAKLMIADDAGVVVTGAVMLAIVLVVDLVVWAAINIRSAFEDGMKTAFTFVEAQPRRES